MSDFEITTLAEKQEKAKRERIKKYGIYGVLTLTMLGVGLSGINALSGSFDDAKADKSVPVKPIDDLNKSTVKSVLDGTYSNKAKALEDLKKEKAKEDADRQASEKNKEAQEAAQKAQDAQNAKIQERVDEQVSQVKAEYQAKLDEAMKKVNDTKQVDDLSKANQSLVDENTTLKSQLKSAQDALSHAQSVINELNDSQKTSSSSSSSSTSSSASE